MHIYRVVLHEKTYVGSVNEGQVCRVAVKAKTVGEAEIKALAWWREQPKKTPCRISDVTELDNEYDELLIK